jgi:hypothetical protein
MRSCRPTRSQQGYRTPTRPRQVYSSHRHSRLINLRAATPKPLCRNPRHLRRDTHGILRRRRLHPHPLLRHNRRPQPRRRQRDPRRTQRQNLRMHQRQNNQRSRNRRLQRERNHCGPTATATQKGSRLNKGFLEHDGTSNLIDLPHPALECVCCLDTAHLDTVPPTGAKSRDVR